MLETAWALNECTPDVVELPTFSGEPAESRPGDDFNERGDIRDVLRRHGWTLAQAGENEYWRRPGKTSGWSATLKDGVFYVFSSSAAPFEPNRAYSPFGVYSLLEHNGDYAVAASTLRANGYGGDAPETTDVDLSRIMAATVTPLECRPRAGPEDPGPISDEMLRIPGFVSEVIDLCLQTAPYALAARRPCSRRHPNEDQAGTRISNRMISLQSNPSQIRRNASPMWDGLPRKVLRNATESIKSVTNPSRTSVTDFGGLKCKKHKKIYLSLLNPSRCHAYPRSTPVRVCVRGCDGFPVTDFLFHTLHNSTIAQLSRPERYQP